MKKLTLSKLMMAFFMSMLLAGATGCHFHEAPQPAPCNGGAGVAGLAFFSIDWEQVPPDYLWTDNTAIPPVFTYGDFYQSGPGNFDLYYEGEFIENCCPVQYQWDVNFDVWVNLGTTGPCGEPGYAGADSYLTLVCGPYGPYEARTNKTKQLPDGMKLISDTGDQIIVEKEVDDVKMRITYTKAKESKKATLDAKHVKTGQAKTNS